MINRQTLLADLRRLVGALEIDLRQRVDEEPAIAAMLQQEYDAARAAKRTGAALEEWRADLATQVAVGWVLSCVFVRFLEDNGLVAPARLSGPVHAGGPGGGLQRARDEREAYFRQRPTDSDRDYLRALFTELGGLPGARDLFGPHNPALAYPGWLSGDAAGRIIEFFRTVDPGTGELAHDFTDPAWDTRFLGDLYQDLSEEAQKKYALLQTPVFVEEFILARTLEPAILEFGLAVVLLIDPACGSGHFLLGAFRRLLEHWRRQFPAMNDRERVNRALAAIHGVDLNPYAVAIARFRLLLAAMRETGVTRLAEAPAFRFNLACGDSLLHGAPAGEQQGLGDLHELAYVYKSEDLGELRRILTPGRYHAVVANPPYIVAHDRVLNAAYRERYPQVCHRQYSLAVPFLQRIVSLAVPAGFTGQITANSFMKAEFGKKLIESYLPTTDLTHVIDTSGAEIPAHETPTVILFARHRQPVAPTVRAVMGIKGEPTTPADPACGLVWSAILDQVDRPGSQSDFVSVADTPREQFHKHPWSIGGGGAAELKDAIDTHASTALSSVMNECGRTTHTGEDGVFYYPGNALATRGLSAFAVPLVEGEQVRDFQVSPETWTLFPYAPGTGERRALSGPEERYYWSCRTPLRERRDFEQTPEERGLRWYDHSMFFPNRYRTPLSIVFAFVATHNHFVLDRGGKVFTQTAPVIKLPADATEDEHLAVLGLLNSSTACFWLKQVCFPRGGFPEGKWQERMNINSTPLSKFPLPAGRPLELARELDRLAQELSALRPAAVLLSGTPRSLDCGGLTPLSQAAPRPSPDPVTVPGQSGVESARCAHDPSGTPQSKAAAPPPLPARLAAAHAAYDSTLARMIALQEELDWECYALYGLLPEADAAAVRSPAFRRSLSAPQTPAEAGTPDLGSEEQGPCLLPPPLHLGERAFEIVLARRMAAGEEQTSWFERHGSTPITDLPAAWPPECRAVVERRIALVGEDRNLGLIERPEHKRRWNLDPWDEQQQRALREGLLDRLESCFDLDGRMNLDHTVTAAPELQTPHLFSAARLADLARADAAFMEIAEVYSGRVDFDVARLVAELVAAESVPLLPALRYKPAGLDKRRAWERTWDLQRLEDAIEALFEQQQGRGAAPAPLPGDRRPPGPPDTGRGDGGPTKPGEQSQSAMSGPASPHPVAGPEIQALGLAPEAATAVLHELRQATAIVAQARAKGMDLASEPLRAQLAPHLRAAQRAATGDIPVPPKYSSADFLGGDIWRLRGKLDVPKERWVSFPHCEGADGSLVLAWAGYDHLQLAQAIAEHYELAKQNEGRTLLPLLVGLAELIPWLKQWHNDHDPVYNARLGDYYAEYLAGEAKAQGLTLDQLRAWTPPPAVRGRRGKK